VAAYTLSMLAKECRTNSSLSKIVFRIIHTMMAGFAKGGEQA
jgi:hypothetical protein